jgi:hypothetical protein
MKTLTCSSACAALAILAAGITVNAQTVVTLPAVPALHTLYGGFPAEVVQASIEADRTRRETEPTRIARRVAADEALEALSTEIKNDKGTTTSLLAAVVRYENTVLEAFSADRSMSSADHKLHMAYIDWLLKAKEKVPAEAVTAFDKWFASSSRQPASQRHSVRISTLKDANSEVARRRKIEEAEFDKFRRRAEEMMRRDIEMMERMRNADNPAPAPKK